MSEEGPTLALMERQRWPLLELDGTTEVSRADYWGTKDIAKELSSTPQEIATCLRHVGLLERGASTAIPTTKALTSGLCKEVLQQTKDGLQKGHRWQRVRILPIVSDAMKGPQQPGRTSAVQFEQTASPKSLEQRVSELEEILRRNNLL